MDDRELSELIRPRDWRSIEDYAYTQGLRLHDWAWEFLRRNPDFIEANIRYWGEDPSSEPPGSLEDYTNSHYPFGLEESVDYRLRAGVTTVTWITSVGVQIVEHPSQLPDDDDPFMDSGLALGFDVSLPIEPQLASARKILKLYQQAWLSSTPDVDAKDIGSSIRPRRDRFVLYIRLLDAKASGATFGEMARRIHEVGDWRSAKKTLRTAQLLSDSGYLQLLKMENVIAT